MTDNKNSTSDKNRDKDQAGLSTSDIIKMSEEIGADWLNKQSENKIKKPDDTSTNDKKGKFSLYNL